MHGRFSEAPSHQVSVSTQPLLRESPAAYFLPLSLAKKKELDAAIRGALSTGQVDQRPGIMS